MKKPNVPDAGEIVWINFTPQADQVKSLDWRSGDAKPKGRVSPEQLAEVRAKIHALSG
ncbi:MAG: hypothetical protein ABI693_10720 [Bryobacteraceae bacterium]